MACTVGLAVGNEWRHGSPGPERKLAVLNQRLVLSYISASQGIPARHED